MSSVVLYTFAMTCYQNVVKTQDQDEDSEVQDQGRDQDLNLQDQDQDQDFNIWVWRRLKNKTQFLRTTSLNTKPLN